MNLSVQSKENLTKLFCFLKENQIDYNLRYVSFQNVELPEIELYVPTAHTPTRILYIDSEVSKIRFFYKGVLYYDGTSNNWALDLAKFYYSQGIKAFFIYDGEINDTSPDAIRKWNVIKSYLLALCNKVKYRINARDTVLREISNREAKEFLQKNSFYGFRPATLTLALFTKKPVADLDKDAIVSVYSTGLPFLGRAGSSNNIECLRSSTLLHHQVRGASSKFLKFLIDHPIMKRGKREFEWDYLTFYVDAAHNFSNSLHALNFKFIKFNPGFLNHHTPLAPALCPPSWKSVSGKLENRRFGSHSEVMCIMTLGGITSVTTPGIASWVYSRTGDYSKYKEPIKPFPYPQLHLLG